LEYPRCNQGPRRRTRFLLDAQLALRLSCNRFDPLFSQNIANNSKGAATESNYCAGNSFLDSFAAYRRSKGLPAVALGLGAIKQVGFLHEHSDIEQMLARRGVTAISEEDMLQLIDIALRTSIQSNLSDARTRKVHILTGLESIGMQSIWDEGFKGSQEFIMSDKRVSILALGNSRFKETQTGPEMHNEVMPILSAAFAAENQESAQKVVFKALADKLSQLTLTPLSDIAAQIAFSALGMDSLVTAEFRTFIFRTFRVDVAFMDLMDNKNTMSDLTNLVCNKVVKKGKPVATASRRSKSLFKKPKVQGKYELISDHA
jgi:hypothetical protein